MLTKFQLGFAANLCRFQKLTKAEARLLNEIYEEFGNWNRFDLAAYTKKFPEYKPTETRIRTYLDEILSNIFSEEDAIRVESKLEEKAYLDLAVGG